MSNNYTGLRQFKDKNGSAGRRCAQRLLALRESLSPLRKRKRDSSLLLATWNIRDFDSNKFGFGPRLEESFYYIAEIISCFDLVAVQEVNRDLSALEKAYAHSGTRMGLHRHRCDARDPVVTKSAWLLSSTPRRCGSARLPARWSYPMGNLSSRARR